MVYWKSFGLGIFAAVYGLGGTASSAYAQCDPGLVCATEWNGGSVINLGGLPGNVASYAFVINNGGQVVGEV